MKSWKLTGLVLAVLLAGTGVVLGAEQQYDIKEMTPEIQSAFSSRHARHEELRALKASGRVGENNHGYVESLDKGPALDEIVRAENADRRIIYNAIVHQNGLGVNGLPQVEAVFAGVHRDRTKSGEYIQKPSGEWVQK